VKRNGFLPLLLAVKIINKLSIYNTYSKNAKSNARVASIHNIGSFQMKNAVTLTIMQIDCVPAFEIFLKHTTTNSRNVNGDSRSLDPLPLGGSR
jgi:hypothetical protein